MTDSFSSSAEPTTPPQPPVSSSLCQTTITTPTRTTTTTSTTTTTTTTTPSSSSSLLLCSFEEALEDVHTRFLLNLPDEELATPDRIFFQLEQAWWFYEDLICDANNIKNNVTTQTTPNNKDATTTTTQEAAAAAAPPPLPRFKTLKPFALKLFQMSPLLRPLLDNFEELWQEFSLYKRSISTYGTILLNENCDKVVLCQLYNSPAWTFPAGKVNQNEAGRDAAARETYEETGFDPHCQLGMTSSMLVNNNSSSRVTWTTPLKEEDALVFQEGLGGGGNSSNNKRRTCYVCRGVPEDFAFAPVARKEVGKVEWHDLDHLPAKTFAVKPYMSQLKRWIRNNNNKTGVGGRKKTPGKKRTGSRPKSRPKSRGGRHSRGRVRETDTNLLGLAEPGEEDGWTEEDMFRANEKLLGRKITYDGSPHHFAEKGFDGMDPHAFHVVGGSFMNSSSEGVVAKLAPAPEQSRLQSLFNKSQVDDDDDDDELKPFFSDEGETPWGEVVTEALESQVASTTHSSSNNKRKRSREKGKSPVPAAEDAGRVLLSMLHSGGQAEDEQVDEAALEEETFAEVFMTDAEITARSQKEKLQQYKDKSIRREEKEQSAREWLDEWVRNLPQTPATERFGDFRFDIDAIMLAMKNI